MERWCINPPAALTTLSLPNQQYRVGCRSYFIASSDKYGALTRSVCLITCSRVHYTLIPEIISGVHVEKLLVSGMTSLVEVIYDWTPVNHRKSHKVNRTFCSNIC